MLDEDERASVEAKLGLVLGSQAGESTWCFQDRPLAPGEFLYVFPGLPRGVVIAEDRHGVAGRGFRTGGMVWDAGDELAAWICSAGAEACFGWPWSSVTSALELGAGVGLLATTLALRRGVPLVVATDGDDSLCADASANAARNGIGGGVRGMRLQWGCESDCEQVLGALGGRCSPLVLAADVLYDWSSTSIDALERTMRALLARGGCRLAVFAWRVRTCREESFLPRLADLGRVETVWRSEGGDAPPAPGDEAALNEWAARNMGTRAISVLRPFLTGV